MQLALEELMPAALDKQAFLSVWETSLGSEDASVDIGVLRGRLIASMMIKLGDQKERKSLCRRVWHRAFELLDLRVSPALRKRAKGPAKGPAEQAIHPQWAPQQPGFLISCVHAKGRKQAAVAEFMRFFSKHSPALQQLQQKVSLQLLHGQGAALMFVGLMSSGDLQSVSGSVDGLFDLHAELMAVFEAMADAGESFEHCESIVPLQRTTDCSNSSSTATPW